MTLDLLEHGRVALSDEVVTALATQPCLAPPSMTAA
jgi:hypothetical protein